MSDSLSLINKWQEKRCSNGGDVLEEEVNFVFLEQKRGSWGSKPYAQRHRVIKRHWTPGGTGKLLLVTGPGGAAGLQ